MAKARIAFREFVILLDPEAINHVLQKKHRNYNKSFAYDGLKEFLGDGLLTAEGDRWLRNRRVLQPGFHRDEIRNMKTTMQELIKGKISNLPSQISIELQPFLLEWTRDVLLKSIFGLEANEIPGMDSIHEHLWFLRNYANNRMKNPLMAPPAWPTKTNRKFKKTVKELELIILDIFQISAHKKDQGKIIQHMLEERKNERWDDQQIFDEIVTLFLAGQETTTNALVFLVHCLLEHPDYLKRVRDHDDKLQWSHIVQEVLRLYPPGWALSRVAIANDTVMGEKIARGTTMFLSIYTMHRHPKFWTDPNQFKPERFLGDFQKRAYLPFGLGPRMCIGNHFALMEMEVIAKSLFQHFKISKSHHQKFELVTPMTMGLEDQYHVILKKRNAH